MKINFGSKNNSKYRTETMHGSYEDMLKRRAAELESMQAGVVRIINEWDGQMITILITKEDENGYPVGSEVITTGCSKVESSVRHAEELDSHVNRFTNHLKEQIENQIKNRNNDVPVL